MRHSFYVHPGKIVRSCVQDIPLFHERSGTFSSETWFRRPLTLSICRYSAWFGHSQYSRRWARNIDTIYMFHINIPSVFGPVVVESRHVNYLTPTASERIDRSLNGMQMPCSIIIFCGSSSDSTWSTHARLWSIFHNRVYRSTRSCLLNDMCSWN